MGVNISGGKTWPTQRPGVAVDELVALASEHGFSAACGVWEVDLRGWVQQAQGERAEGLTQLRQGLDRIRALGSGLE